MRRVVIPELLDSDSGTPDQIRASLRDLRNINRWFGGVSTTQIMIERVARHTGQHHLSLLEVAAGTADAPLAASANLARQGIHVAVTLLDRSASHMNGSQPKVAGDALALPFRDNSFDLVSCVLFAHHLEPDELKSFIAEGMRVCRTAVLINDLRRSRLHLALIYAGLPLFSTLTRHDSVASIKRAYTPDELAAMLACSGADHFEIFNSYLCRMGAIAWKPSSAEHSCNARAAGRSGVTVSESQETR
jgi:ubiquinone/menaquinone biosynthesis C-methylase UbiE